MKEMNRERKKERKEKKEKKERKKESKLLDRRNVEIEKRKTGINRERERM
jgi:hypothetical protein